MYQHQNYHPKFSKHDQKRHNVDKPNLSCHSLVSRNIAIDIEKRKDLLRMKRMCFNCLKGVHTEKNCKKKIKCFNCKAEGHPTPLCNLASETQSYATNENKEKSDSCLMKSNTKILVKYVQS